MAPEQILSSRETRPAADLYALGAVLYRAVTGRHVFGDLRGAALARHKLVTDAPKLVTGRRDRVARGFEGVVLATMPEDRYPVAEALLADLRALEELAPPPARARPWLRRAITALVVLGGAGAVSQEPTIRECMGNLVTHK